ncbi:unnamed protein product, partial [Staurois parvus]
MGAISISLCSIGEFITAIVMLIVLKLITKTRFPRPSMITRLRILDSAN